MAKTRLIALCSVGALLIACGDDFSIQPNGAGATAGSSGTAGSSAAGSAGSQSGGSNTGATAGSDIGGTGGSGQSGNSGVGGSSAGSSGTGGVSGTAGVGGSVAGSGGSVGGSGPGGAGTGGSGAIGGTSGNAGMAGNSGTAGMGGSGALGGSGGQPIVCGNSIPEDGEECDDGNDFFWDGCTPDCVVEHYSNTCADGQVQYNIGEQCDDFNQNAGDGCYLCHVEIPITCGDNLLQLDQNEQCDDGNQIDGDGCAYNCRWEVNTSSCGNNFTTAGEYCDDGGHANGDACNPTCQFTNNVTTFLGNAMTPGAADGNVMQAQFAGTSAFTSYGDYLWVAMVDEIDNTHVIRQVYVPDRAVITVAGGQPGYQDASGLSARFAGPNSITTDGSVLWVGDEGNRRIRSMSLTPPFKVTTVVGNGNVGTNDGIGTSATIDGLRGVTYFRGYVYFLDSNQGTLRRLDPSSDTVTTIAGTVGVLGYKDGPGNQAQFMSPRYMTHDGGSLLYIVDTNACLIRSYNVDTTEVRTVAGTPGTAGILGVPGIPVCAYLDGSGTSAKFARPRGIAFDGSSLYVLEQNNHILRQIELFNGARVTTMVGDSFTSMPGYVDAVGTNARLSGPMNLAFHPNSHSLFISESGTPVLRQIQLQRQFDRITLMNVGL